MRSHYSCGGTISRRTLSSLLFFCFAISNMVRGSHKLLWRLAKNVDYCLQTRFVMNISSPCIRSARAFPVRNGKSANSNLTSITFCSRSQESRCVARTNAFTRADLASSTLDVQYYRILNHHGGFLAKANGLSELNA